MSQKLLKLLSLGSINEGNTIYYLENNRIENIDEATLQARTALHIAALKGFTNVVNALLELGANPNMQDSLGETPLMKALKNQHETTAHALINEKLQVDLANEDGQTALHFAASQGFTDVINALLKLDANPNAQDKNKATPFLASLGFWGNEPMALALVNDKLQVDLADEDGQTALHFAALRGFPNVVKALLELGANPNAQVQDGETPLIGALRQPLIDGSRGKYEATALELISDKINVNYVDEYGQTAIYYAAANGFVDVIKALLKQGADPNVLNKDGETPVIEALQRGRGVPTVLALFNGGAVDRINSPIQNRLNSSITPSLFAMLSHTKLHAALYWEGLSRIRFSSIKELQGSQKRNIDYLRMRGEAELAERYQSATSLPDDGKSLDELWTNLLKKKPLDGKDNVSLTIHLFANATQEARDVAYPEIIKHLKALELNKPATSETQALTDDALKDAASDRLNALIAQHLEDQPFLAYELLSYAFSQQDCDATEVMMKAASEDASLYPEKHAVLLDRLVHALFTAEYSDESTLQVSLFETNAARLQKTIDYSLQLIQFSIDDVPETNTKYIEKTAQEHLSFLPNLLIAALPHAHEIATDNKQNPLHLLAIHCPAALDDYKFSTLNACNINKLNEALKQKDPAGNTPLAYAKKSGNKKLIKMYQSWVEAAGTETHSDTSSIDDVLAETPPAICHSTPETASEIAELNVTPSTSAKTKNKNRP